MSKEHYEGKLPLLETLATQKLPRPYMPIAAALQEAEDLYIWAQTDQTTLEGVGLNWAIWGEDLLVRAGALRHAQALWASEQHSQQQAQKNWKAAAKVAYKLRNDLLADFRYAFRNQADLLSRVREISKGHSHADMIQDLSDLSALGKENLHELTQIKFDHTYLDKAATQAQQLAVLLARVNGSAQTRQAKQLRDAAFAHLKEAVTEIRKAGKYAFRQQKERYQGYVSPYYQK